MKKKTSKKLEDLAGLDNYNDMLSSVIGKLINLYAEEELDDFEVLELFSAMVCLLTASHNEIMNKLKEFE